MRLLLASLIVVLAAVFAPKSLPTVHGQALIDVSWPNCGLKSFVMERQGIVGINGGLNFHPNPCLATQTGWFNRFGVYVSTGYPGIKYGRKYQHYPKNCGLNETDCLAYNYGFNAARYDIKYASLHYVLAKQWWLDVETENSWTDSTNVNRAALLGMMDGLSAYAGQSNLGFYSYPGQWNLLTGHWHNGYPAWMATGSSHENAAKMTCRSDAFTAGKVALTQYTQAFDLNIACAQTY